MRNLEIDGPVESMDIYCKAENPKAAFFVEDTWCCLSFCAYLSASFRYLASRLIRTGPSTRLSFLSKDKYHSLHASFHPLRRVFLL